MPKNTHPCSVCGGGDDEGTLLVCEGCDRPFHNDVNCAEFITGCDHAEWFCGDCSEQQRDEDEEGASQDEEGASVAAGA